MTSELIVSASGIRGIVGRGLDARVAYRYGVAYGEHLSARNGTPASGMVLLGRDSRTSGLELADAVADGLMAVGWDVGDLGIVPTPTALLAVQEDDRARGGLIVTASHNPADWNGLKLGSGSGAFITPEDGREVQARFEALTEGAAPRAAGGSSAVGSARTGRRVSVEGAIARHIDRILGLSLLFPTAVLPRRLHVAVDAVRGTGGLIVPPLLQRMGCEVIGIHLEPDGRFPRDPEPSAANLAELGELVRETGADLGMAIDPDADRLALVDDRGRAIGEDWTLALATELVLSRNPGPVVTNLSTSQCIEDAARRAGAALHRAPVGEANVAGRMAEVGAVVGGEGNGGVMLPALHPTRDAPLAAALTVQLLSERNASLSDILGRYPSYAIAKRKVRRPSEPLAAVYQRLESEAPSGSRADRQDGLRLAWPDRREWLHVRPSGTEPIVRIIAEAPQESAAHALSDWAAEILSS